MKGKLRAAILAFWVVVLLLVSGSFGSASANASAWPHGKHPHSKHKSHPVVKHKAPKHPKPQH
jgi:hypothetical protein